MVDDLVELDFVVTVDFWPLVEVDVVAVLAAGFLAAGFLAAGFLAAGFLAAAFVVAEERDRADVVVLVRVLLAVVFLDVVARALLVVLFGALDRFLSAIGLRLADAGV